MPVRPVALPVVLWCFTETFERKFTEQSLGLVLNIGEQNRIILKRCMPESPASSRRIPPGVFVTTINGESIDHRSLKDVQKMIIKAERPITVGFAQSETSRAISQSSIKASEKEQADKKEAIRQREEAAARTYPIEMAETFTREFVEARLGLALEEHPSGRTLIKHCLPHSPAAKDGVRPGVTITAINDHSVEFRRFKEVKKLIELAERPILIAFSGAEPPQYPQGGKRRSQKGVLRRNGSGADENVPAYALRPA